MISKILLSFVIFASVFYSIGCCMNDCRFPPGAVYKITYEDGSSEQREINSDGCVGHDCDKGDPTGYQIVVNLQV